MTNYEALYNQAMAHNAMLREALDFYSQQNHLSDRADSLLMVEEGLIAKEAIAATGPDVEAWLQTHDDKQFNVYTQVASETCAVAINLKQRLATVTAERDALLECCKKKVETPFHSYDDFTRGEVACAESILDLSEALAQKGGE